MNLDRQSRGSDRYDGDRHIRCAVVVHTLLLRVEVRVFRFFVVKIRVIRPVSGRLDKSLKPVA
jgi:hypothetical protein